MLTRVKKLRDRAQASYANVLILEAAIEIPRHSKLILAADKKKKITDSKLILAIEITLFWLGAFVDRPTGKCRIIKPHSHMNFWIP